MLGDERPKPGKAEHLSFRVVSLYKPVAVEEDALTSIEHYLVLLVAHVRHKPQGHPSSPQLLGGAVTVYVGRVVARVGVSQATALGVEYGVEAGDEHVSRYAGDECLVDPLEHLAGRGGVQRLRDGPEHAAGGGH